MPLSLPAPGFSDPHPSITLLHQQKKKEEGKIEEAINSNDGSDLSAPNPRSDSTVQSAPASKRQRENNSASTPKANCSPRTQERALLAGRQPSAAAQTPDSVTSWKKFQKVRNATESRELQ